MTCLGQVIDTLSCFPANMKMDEPQALFSWRGSYDELSLSPSRDTTDQTVQELLDVCRAAVGGTFTGYKGGEYVMTDSTPVWADPYGEYLQQVVIGFIVSTRGTLIVATAPGRY